MKKDFKHLFIEKSNRFHNNKYDYSLVDYIDGQTKVKIICPIHGIFEQIPVNHSNRYGCQLCYGNQRKTKEIFIEKSNKIHNNKYDYSLVEYTNNKTKVKIICPEHGIFETRPDNHTNKKSGCPKCANNILYSVDEFIEKSNKIHNNKYDYSLVDYKTGHIKIKIICPIHGIFVQKPYSHLRGLGCKSCSKKNTTSNEEFIKISNKIHNFKYDYKNVNIISNRKNIKIICPIHGEFEQLVYYHMKGGGCYKCKESKGEKIITEYLYEKNLKFEPQKKFSQCKNIFKLPFDFYLPQYNLCIEYDGEQHFRPIEIWGGEKSFKKLIINDKIKTDFCKKNNINLIRIPYTEIDNIENILNESINNFIIYSLFLLLSVLQVFH